MGRLSNGAAVAPEIIINVNSEMAWDCCLHHGKQLSRHMRLAACLCFATNATLTARPPDTL